MTKRFSLGHSCHRWDEFKVNEKDRLQAFDFTRCPYCGDPLAYDHMSRVKVELDTLHYKEKRLVEFVDSLRKDYRYKILDIYKSNSIFLLLLEVKDDGDKIAIQLQNYPEVKMAYDKRHERIVLNQGL